jgi:hypothetical protein
MPPLPNALLPKFPATPAWKPRAEAESMKNKIIIESDDIYILGIREKAFKPENVIVVDDCWDRVRKPTDGKPRCVILWARDNPQDTNPTEAKIVSVFNKEMPFVLFVLTRSISLVQLYITLRNLQNSLVNVHKN